MSKNRLEGSSHRIRVKQWFHFRKAYNREMLHHHMKRLFFIDIEEYLLGKNRARVREINGRQKVQSLST